jgi:glycine oxidase
MSAGPARPRGPAPRVVVVGGGIAGCAAAIELAGRGADVTLLEADQPGVRATGASAGMVAPQYEAAGPGPFFRLGVASRDAYPAFVERIEALAEWPLAFRSDGMLVANRTEEDEAGARDALAWQREEGLRGEVLTPAQALERHPGLSPEVRSWVWLPDEAQVDAQRLAVALGSAVRAAGARLGLGQRVVEVLSGSGRATSVRTEAGETFAADAVVLAAGAWSGKIAGLPRELPIRPVRGQILRLLPAEMPGWPLVATHEGRYLVPRQNGTLLLGSTMEDVGFDDSVTAEARLELAEIAAELVPALADAPIVERWAGLRPMSADGWPVVGPDPELEGLFYATGHGRNGILLGPLTGRVIADLVLDGASPLGWQAFGPERLDRRARGES